MPSPDALAGPCKMASYSSSFCRNCWHSYICCRRQIDQKSVLVKWHGGIGVLDEDLQYSSELYMWHQDVPHIIRLSSSGRSLDNDTPACQTELPERSCSCFRTWSRDPAAARRATRLSTCRLLPCHTSLPAYQPLWIWPQPAPILYGACLSLRWSVLPAWYMYERYMLGHLHEGPFHVL